MSTLQMSNKEVARRALLLWRNLIQTGDVTLSTQDAINAGQADKCRMLNSDQQEFVIRLEELADRMSTGGSV